MWRAGAWSAGRVAILGDAAFLARPHVGAGVTKAAEDAMALAAALRENEDIAAALSQFERQRLSPNQRITARGRDLGAYLAPQATPEQRAKAEASQPAGGGTARSRAAGFSAGVGIPTQSCACLVLPLEPRCAPRLPDLTRALPCGIIEQIMNKARRCLRSPPRTHLAGFGKRSQRSIRKRHAWKRQARFRFGLPAVDDALEGGLACGALHEFAPAAPGCRAGATCGFALALAALAAAAERGRSVLLIQTDFGVLETGAPYGPGLAFFGLPLERLLCLRVARPLDALWAFEEALKSPSLAAVLAELPQDGAAADLTATRRLALAARAGSGLGLLLRQRPSPEPTAALTRWAVAGAPGTPDEFGGLGRTAFDLSLSKNRRGRCGRFRVWWNHDDRRFDQEALTTALSLGVAAPARDRPDHAPLVRAG